MKSKDIAKWVLGLIGTFIFWRLLEYVEGLVLSLSGQIPPISIESTILAILGIGVIVGVIGLALHGLWKSIQGRRTRKLISPVDLTEFDDRFRAVKEVQTSKVKMMVFGEFRAVLHELLYTHSWNHEIRQRVTEVISFIEQKLPVADIKDAETYLDWLDLIVDRSRRSDEKTFDMVKERFSPTIDSLYCDPKFERNSKILAIKQMLHRYDEKFMAQLTDEAIHKWSDLRFDNLLGVIRLNRLAERDRLAFKRVREHIRDKMTKAEKNGDGAAFSRAEKLYEMVKNL